MSIIWRRNHGKTVLLHTIHGAGINFQKQKSFFGHWNILSCEKNFSRIFFSFWICSESKNWKSKTPDFFPYRIYIKIWVVCLSVFLSVSLFVCVSGFRTFVCVSVCLFVCPVQGPWFVYQFVCLCVRRSEHHKPAVGRICASRSKY